jgi:hypothetical protein
MSSGIVYAPILHGSLPFAVAVRDIFLRERPDCVAVELPDTLSAAVDRAVRRLPLLSVIRYPAAKENAFLLVEPCDGIFEALRLAREHRIPAHLVDRDTDAYEPRHDRVPDPFAVHHIGYESYAREVTAALAQIPPSPEDELREATMAFHLRALALRYEKVLFVCGMAHVQRVEAMLASAGARPLGRTKRAGIQVFHLHEASAREVLSEPGHVQELFERWRSSEGQGVPVPGDRFRMSRDLLMAARERMRVRDGERVEARALRVALQFARNQALLRGALAPDLYELAIGARGAASDDLAWHVWDLGVAYPHQTDTPDLPAYNLTLDELGHRTRRVIWRRRLKGRRHDLRLLRGQKQRPVQAAELERLREPYICSYPPEDVRIEAYGDYLKNRGKSLVASERARVAPLVAGFGDGIDLRETIRNMPHDGRLYIVEHRASPANVGAVCVIFEAEDRENRFPWRVTWQGEHEHESDMALYATAPDANVVGPSIGRAEYGGFLMTSPPGRMFQVFEDPYFDEAETPAERLLYAAIDYCTEPSILYVAARAPRPKLTALARRSGKKLVYLPIGQLSPTTLRKLRVFHVLGGRAVRDYAENFIGR